MMKKLICSLQILACGALSAQPNQKPPKEAPPLFERGDKPLVSSPMAPMQPAAYNYPANVKVNYGWDFYTDVSYLYWYAGQDSMDLARTGLQSSELFDPSTSNGFVVVQDFKYNSGFKVGLGANLNTDDWVVDVEYTYMRQNTATSSGSAPAGTNDSVSLPGVFAFNNWFITNVYGTPIVGQSFQSNWKLGLDWIDLTFQRPFYQGTKLTVLPSAGLRASLIRQHLTIAGQGVSAVYDSPPSLPYTSNNHSQSWAIGPRGVVDAHWLIGGGFRVQGNMGASLLFTQYTTISHSETASSTNEYLSPNSYNMSNYNCLRPMAEGNLGIGWGSYFAGSCYHFDLSATYDFNYLWGQNMMKYFVDVLGIPGSGFADALYLHGLTVKARFDF